MFDNKSLCLNMIVKNESDIIEETLEDLCSKFMFDYWVIADTGSTDGTQLKIQQFFDSKNIPGELVEHTWRDFAFNRNRVLECAFNKTDYILLWNAGEKICGTFKLPQTVDKKIYYLKKNNGGIIYKPLLLSNRDEWKYIGILYESLISLIEITPRDEDYINGDYFIQRDKISNRQNDIDKYENYGNLLEEAIKTEEDDILCARYVFYCAQSYRKSGNDEKAIEWYKRIISDDRHCEQERYYSFLQLGILCYKNGYTMEALMYLEFGMGVDEERPECISYLMEFYYDHEMYSSVMALCYYFKEKNMDIKIQFLSSGEKLFLDEERIHYIYYYISICANHDEDSINRDKAIKYLLSKKNEIPSFMRDYVSHIQ